MPHLGLEAATKLPHHRQFPHHLFHRLATPLLETNRHHGTSNGTANSTRVADPSCESNGYLGNDVVPYLYPEFLAHGQKDRLRSNVPLTHKLCGAILFHHLLLFPVSCPHFTTNAPTFPPFAGMEDDYEA
jgi:hypothetical protein